MMINFHSCMLTEHTVIQWWYHYQHSSSRKHFLWNAASFCTPLNLYEIWCGYHISEQTLSDHSVVITGESRWDVCPHISGKYFFYVQLIFRKKMMQTFKNLNRNRDQSRTDMQIYVGTDLDLWPFDLRVNACRWPVMDYISTEFGVGSSSLFPCRVQANAIRQWGRNNSSSYPRLGYRRRG